MTKLTVYRKIIVLVAAIFCLCGALSAQYPLHIEVEDKPPAFLRDTLKLTVDFTSREACMAYIGQLPELLLSKGYPAASVDSVYADSSRAWCLLYAGDAVRHTYINTDSINQSLLDGLGWSRRKKQYSGLKQVQTLQDQLLDHMEKTGYPFAQVHADSIYFSGDSMYADVRLEKGPLYSIDSIRNLGSGSISSSFLEQYLGLPNGALYNKDKLKDVSAKIRELPFLREAQPWNLTLLGTGSILNVYLEPKKSSEVNVLLGLLPANDQLAGNKMLITGEAQINLKNALGNGETIGLDWQQIQVKSPRLDLLFIQPYLFGSPFGMNLNFNLFKKDSSFVNISMRAGATYSVSARQSGTVFIQQLTTNLLTVDTFAVKRSRMLPREADVRSVNLGVLYEWFNTDYRFNPRRGNELRVTASAGNKQIRKNNVVVKLTDQLDPSFDFNSLYDTFRLKSYQFRLQLEGARYFPLGKASTVKTAFHGGWFQSPSIFRNELFQIGGYKLLRGFDEESIFSSAYGVVTAEYRYLLGQNSFLSAFADYGVSTDASQETQLHTNYLGAGIGMSFETKAGIFNISYAAGKRGDQSFNLRQSKIHLGYVNYF